MKRCFEKCRLHVVGCLVALLGLGSNANAGLIIDADSLYLERANNHPYVGWVERTDSLDGTQFNASAVLIDPHWVLMSAHQSLRNDFDLNSRYESFRFGLGSNYFSNPGENMTASELFIHPSYAGAGLGGSGYDLAMLYFDNPFLSVTPAELYQEAVVTGLDSDIVGFGNRQFVNDSVVDFTGDRRAGNNVTRVSAAQDPEFFITSLRDTTSSTFRPLGMAGRGGDSGGGLFIDSELAGIVSGGGISSTYGTQTFYSRIDIEWINSTIATRSTTSVPEPSSMALCLFSSAFALVRRRRQRKVMNWA